MKTTQAPPTSGRFAIASLTFEVGAGGAAVQLLPADEFRAADGRAQPWGSWKLTPEIAARLVAEANERPNKYVIDYEHQTQLANENGQPAPASGWFKTLEFRPGQGLYATDVAWTARAKGYIDGQEYKYISPVFEFDKKTGEVQRLLTVALTNDPGLHGMDEVTLAVLSARFNQSSLTAGHTSTQETAMNPVLLALLKALGLTETATETEAVSAVVALKAKSESVDTLTTQIASLKSAPPDPAKFVPIEKLADLNTEIVTLKAAQLDRDVTALLDEAKAAGKVTPSIEAEFRAIGKSDIAQLKRILEVTPANPALAGHQQTQTKTQPDPAGALSDAELAVCKAMGMTAEQYRKGAVDAS